MNGLTNFSTRYAPLVGRIMIAFVFLWSAWEKINGFQATAGAMGGRGMPMPELLLVIGIFIELLGSAMLVLGWHTRLGALSLMVFLLVATLYFHNYWSFPPNEQRNQRNHFTKNIGFVGGLLVIMGLGPGPISVDNRRKLGPVRGA